MAAAGGGGGRVSPNQFGQSKEAELARLATLVGTAGRERESWDSYKGRERAKRQEETDKGATEERGHRGDVIEPTMTDVNVNPIL